MKIINLFNITVLALCTSAFFFTGLFAQINYSPPPDGWNYTFEGDAAAPDDVAALDGTWMHDNNSDEWDGFEIGDDFIPGGVNLLTDGAASYIRIQDTGDPREYGFNDPGSNRKISFFHLLEGDGVSSSESILDNGITLSFRVRVATGDPLDDVYPDGGAGESPWPAEGNGYLIHDGGNGNFAIRQSNGGMIGFALAMKTDHDTLTIEDKQGLVMNTMNGSEITSDIGLDQGGELNIVELDDPTTWHEFWITISGGAFSGTHNVQVWVDGATTAQTFDVTAGGGGEELNSYLQMGMGNTAQNGAVDIDFLSYKEGVYEPQIASAVETDTEFPQEFDLYNNYPNPFNPATKISFAMKHNDKVSIAVYNTLGQLVETLFNGEKPAGFHSLRFDAKHMSSGVYLYQMRVGDKVFSKKMLLMK